MEVKQFKQLGAYGKRLLTEYQLVLFKKIAPDYTWDEVFAWPNVPPDNVNDFIESIHQWIKKKEDLPF